MALEENGNTVVVLLGPREIIYWSGMVAEMISTPWYTQRKVPVSVIAILDSMPPRDFKFWTETTPAETTPLATLQKALTQIEK